MDSEHQAFAKEGKVDKVLDLMEDQRKTALCGAAWWNVADGLPEFSMQHQVWDQPTSFLSLPIFEPSSAFHIPPNMPRLTPPLFLFFTYHLFSSSCSQGVHVHNVHVVEASTIHKKLRYIWIQYDSMQLLVNLCLSDFSGFPSRRWRIWRCFESFKDFGKADLTAKPTGSKLFRAWSNAGSWIVGMICQICFIVS